MNREPSTASRALRGVSLAITLVSIITFSTIAYSAYADVNGVLSSLRGPSTSATGAHYTVSGNTARLDLNFNVDNGGLYPLSIQLTCANSPSLPVSCGPVSVSIQPGLSRGVDLVLNVNDLARLQTLVSSGAGVHLNATAAIFLQPFAVLSVTFDLGSALSGAKP